MGLGISGCLNCTVASPSRVSIASCMLNLLPLFLDDLWLWAHRGWCICTPRTWRQLANLRRAAEYTLSSPTLGPPIAWKYSIYSCRKFGRSLLVFWYARHDSWGKDEAKDEYAVKIRYRPKTKYLALFWSCASPARVKYTTKPMS